MIMKTRDVCASVRLEESQQTMIPSKSTSTLARAEHLKIALDLRIHSRAIENRVAQAIHLHLRNRKRIANNVLREALDVLTLIRRDATALKFRISESVNVLFSIRKESLQARFTESSRNGNQY